MNLARWNIFILERFPPLRHVLLILCLFGANAFVAKPTAPFSLLCFVVILIAFFRLRVFDEIKDYETDQKINPHRPLARGLISLHEAKRTAFSLLAIELLLSSIIGLPALVAATLYVVYSFLMYKEFFIGSWLRPKLAIYALTHTLVSSLIALFIFSSITGLYLWQAPAHFLLFTIANWMIFNVFEFGRKTFGKEEERTEEDSYSKIFGPWGAMSVVLCMALIAILLAPRFSWPYQGALFLYLLIASFFSVKAFRTACSAFILFYNLIITLGFFIC